MIWTSSLHCVSLSESHVLCPSVPEKEICFFCFLPCSKKHCIAATWLQKYFSSGILLLISLLASSPTSVPHCDPNRGPLCKKRGLAEEMIWTGRGGFSTLFSKTDDSWFFFCCVCTSDDQCVWSGQYTYLWSAKFYISLFAKNQRRGQNETSSNNRLRKDRSSN